jgi:deoxyadenosine/deoxycytidine kinase
MKVICVDGPIGAGKSTLIEMLSKKLNGKIDDLRILFSPEPIEEWRNVGKKKLNILQKFYDDKERYSFTFQFNAFISRISQVEKMIEKEKDFDFVLFIERGIFSDRYIFAELLYELGFLQEIEWEVYKQIFDFLSKKSFKIDGYLYLNYDSDTCIEREKERNREEEKNVDEFYLREVCEKYQKVIRINEEKGENILKIDEIFDKDLNNSIFENIVSKIISFVKKI